MAQFDISAEQRVAQGKGASRRLRHVGKIPGILYGAGSAPVTIQLEHREVMHKAEQEAFYSHVLTLHLDKVPQRVVLKDLQRHPYRPLIMHVDLQRIDENVELTMRVPIHFLNEEACVGVKLGGGTISHLLNDLEVICLPRDLPEFITVDVATMNIGDTIHLGDVVIPPNVQLAALAHGGDPTQPVVSVQAARISEEEKIETVAEGAAPAAAGSESSAAGE
jgi:large subunit ribosomal protein L25